MTNSALATVEKAPATAVREQLNNYLIQLETFQQDNFKLKLEISNEKKRYLDLMDAFLEVRKEQKSKFSESESSFICDQ